MASEVLDRTDFLDKIAQSIAGTIPNIAALSVSPQHILTEDDILSHVAAVRPDLLKQILDVIKAKPRES